MADPAAARSGALRRFGAAGLWGLGLWLNGGSAAELVAFVREERIQHAVNLTSEV